MKPATIGFIPIYESPLHRFLSGRGEIVINSAAGPVCNLWEFLIHRKECDYPLLLDGHFFSKNELLLRAADLLPEMQNEIDVLVGPEGRELIFDMCKEAGIEIDI